MASQDPSTQAPQHPRDWESGLCDCCSPMGTCCWGFWLPCCLFGKTQSRLADPALKEHSYLNGNCCLYYLTAQVGFHWVLLMIRRGEIRNRFGIEGSGCGDCCTSYWCPCCVMIQHEKEVEVQSERVQTGYQAPAGMEYPTPGKAN